MPSAFYKWLSASWWNSELVGRLLPRMIPIAGARVRLTQLAHGTLIDILDTTGWQHPWTTTPSWDGEQWTATVLPGFVNGLPPRVGSLTLLDNPALPLSFRIAGSQEGDSIPPFFKKLGVGDSATGISIDEATGVIMMTTPTPDPNAPAPRLLVACDLFVSVARATYSLETSVTGNLVTGQLVDYTVTYNTSGLLKQGTYPRLLAANWMPRPHDLSLDTQLMGVQGDEGEDRALIATVYLLSPPNPLPSASPDGTWTPYVLYAQAGFWNLNHSVKNIPPATVQQSPLDPALAFYLGQYTTAPAGTYGALQAESQQILNSILNTTSNQGRFWTAV